jgi:hypothetical protein
MAFVARTRTHPARKSRNIARCGENPPGSVRPSTCARAAIARTPAHGGGRPPRAGTCGRACGSCALGEPARAMCPDTRPRAVALGIVRLCIQRSWVTPPGAGDHLRAALYLPICASRGRLRICRPARAAFAGYTGGRICIWRHMVHVLRGERAASRRRRGNGPSRLPHVSAHNQKRDCVRSGSLLSVT